MEFNTQLYQTILTHTKEKDSFAICLGGDHTVAIASALASSKRNGPIGVIWFDAHTDYHTFETTESGNIHGLPLASINNYCKELHDFHDGIFINPKNTVVVGARSWEDGEIRNLEDAGVTVFKIEEVKKEGLEAITKKAFEIANKNTNGVHVSYDLDLLDPHDVPGVSIPAENGLTKEQGLELCNEILKYIDQVVSFDLVEFNPLEDQDNKTEQIAMTILKRTIKEIETIKSRN